MHVVDADELARMAKAMGDYGPMAYVAAVLGVRWGEVAGLRVGRLDFAERTLEVAEQVTRGRGGRHIGAPLAEFVTGRRSRSLRPEVPATMTLVTAEHPPVEMARDRVVVRRYSPADATQLHEAILDSIEHLTPWMPWAGLEPLVLADRKRLIADWRELWETGEDFNFGVFENRRLVGGCGLHRRIGAGGLEIGYWTRAGETGRGIAGEAVRCLVDGAFSMSQVDFIEVHHDVANVASGRIPARLGFTFVGDREDGATAPAEVGVERVWRLDRQGWDAVETRS